MMISAPIMRQAAANLAIAFCALLPTGCVTAQSSYD
jgi:hypothetical protein